MCAGQVEGLHTQPAELAPQCLAVGMVAVAPEAVAEHQHLSLCEWGKKQE